MDIDLNINNFRFALGESLDLKKCNQSNIKKAGFIARLQFNPPKGQDLYWAKNCHITCFDGRFDYRAELGSRPQDIDFMCGTSAFLYFENNLLIKTVFQIIFSRIQATSANLEMKQLMTDKFGLPTNSDLLMSVWKNGDENFICELNGNKDKAYFHWLYE